MARWGGRTGNRFGPASPKTDREEITALVIIAIVTVLLWHSPYGGYLLYPFTILSTWFHEMGHGLAAMAFGHEFERLVIYPNGSGYALHLAQGEPSRIAMAGIAGAGLLGPTVAGCLMILASKTPRATKIALAGLGIMLLASTLVWVRSMTGWIVLPALGIASLWLAFYGSRQHKHFAVQFLGVQGCISIYRDFGYMFSEGGILGGRPQISDTGHIAEALFLPYWFWGGVITAMIAAMVFWSLRTAHRR